MNATLPSITADARERRIRAIRIKLDLHKQVWDKGRTTLLGCECGWSTPNGLSGHQAYRDHLAERIEETTR